MTQNVGWFDYCSLFGMNKPYVRIYPVGNGSKTLIHTSTGKHIIIDCKFRNSAEAESDDTQYDCKVDLLARLPKDSKGRPFVDLFILSHPDLDHCQGFDKHFYTGNPDNYDTKTNEDQILIDELWVTKLVSDTEACDDAKAIEKERKRRYKLYSNDSRSSETSFNRLTMIGYDSDLKYSECPSYTPGNYANHWGGVDHIDIDIFIHAPFKESLITNNENKQEKDPKNNSSIIAQYTLYDSDNKENKLELLEGGDADHYRWEKVKNISEDNGNEDRLRYDLFITPHHCSWGFFNDRPYAENKDPKETSLDIIKYNNASAYIVSNSKPIINDEDNPPHHPAKNEYRGAMHTTSNFKCTGEHPKVSKPEPIQIELSNGKINFADVVKATSAYVPHRQNDKASSYVSKN